MPFLSHQPLQVWTGIHDPKPPPHISLLMWRKASTLNHIVTIWLAHGPRKTDTPTKPTFQGYRDYLLEAKDKTKTSLGASLKSLLYKGHSIFSILAEFSNILIQRDLIRSLGVGGRSHRRRLCKAMVNRLGWYWLRSQPPLEHVEFGGRRCKIKGQKLALRVSYSRMPGWWCCSCLNFPKDGLLERKEFQAQPRVWLVW